jgi:hypothetical protein
MELYDSLFADQELDELVLETDLDPDGPLYAARARLWEGQYQDAATLAAGKGEPWSSFIVSAARLKGGLSAQRTLVYVADNPDFETRVRLWAFTALRKTGYQATALQGADVLGFVVEVPMEGSKDTLAAYADGSIRFVGYKDNIVIREPKDETKPLVEDMLSKAQPLLAVPPAPRSRAPIPVDRVRLTALSAMGLHTIEVPWSDLEPPGKYAELFTSAAKLLERATAPG